MGKDGQMTPWEFAAKCLGYKITLTKNMGGDDISYILGPDRIGVAGTYTEGHGVKLDHPAVINKIMRMSKKEQSG